jgi:hypothetical protein
MSLLTFGENFKDLSTEAALQFEFACDRCHQAWHSPRTPYQPKSDKVSATNEAESAVGTAEALEGKVKDAAYETAHAYALANAVAQARRYFNQCRQCGNWFCGECFDYSYAMCVNCRTT